MDDTVSTQTSSTAQLNRSAPTFAKPYFSAQVQQAAAEWAVFDAPARVHQTCDDGPVVPSAEGVVHPPKLHLLSGIPEMRDQDLPGEEVPGRGRSQEGQSDDAL